MVEDRLKIVVFGSYNSGKSTFIKYIDPDSRHVETNDDLGSTTVALDFGRVDIGDKQVYLFGTPGQERFEFVRQIISRDMNGAIVMVDSTCDIDAMTVSLCEWLAGTGTPFIILLNKCDSEKSSPEKFADIVSWGYAEYISAQTGENVFDALSAFVDRISV